MVCGREDIPSSLLSQELHEWVHGTDSRSLRSQGWVSLHSWRSQSSLDDDTSRSWQEVLRCCFQSRPQACQTVGWSGESMQSFVIQSNLRSASIYSYCPFTSSYPLFMFHRNWDRVILRKLEPSHDVLFCLQNFFFSCHCCYCCQRLPRLLLLRLLTLFQIHVHLHF